MTATEKELEKLSKRMKENIPKIAIPPLAGTIVHYQEFPSNLIPPRPIDVWLPEGYDPESGDRYPVIYMHDGQMMFHHEDSSEAGLDVFWDVDKAITRLVEAGEIRPAIVVAVWMSVAQGARGREYMPQRPVEEVWQPMREAGRAGPIGFADKKTGQVSYSHDYLKFLVEELKPFVDETYPTLVGRSDTFVIGSSMGGLISAYAVEEYPDVFGGAACLSTDWTKAEGVVVQWFNNHWPSAGLNRFYFDYGTETYDAFYEPYQLQIDEVMQRHGFTHGEDWITRRFEGADHSPKAWRERLHIPLKFLLGNSPGVSHT